MNNKEQEAEKSVFAYLRYVTLRQAWAGLRFQFVAWLLLSAVVLVIVLAGKKGIDATEGIWSTIPRPILFIGFVALVTWIVRGDNFLLEWPSSFQEWLLTNIDIAAFIVAAAFLPILVMVPAYLGFAMLVAVLEDLSEIGKANYQRLRTLNPEQSALENRGA